MSDERASNSEFLPARSGLITALRRLLRPGRIKHGHARGMSAVMAIGGVIPVFTGINSLPAVPQASSILCEGYAGCGALGYTGHDYGQHSSTSYWRMSAGNECTNYVAFVESTVYRATTPSYLLGNAGQWAASARAHHVVVNRTPAVGAVAEWDGGSYGIGPLGHVAVVERVGPRDSYIVISQQNISSDTDHYDWTRIRAGFPASQWQEWPSSFIHFPAAGHAAVGYYSPASHSFSLRESLSSGPASYTFTFGRAGVIPLVGEWTRGTVGAGYYDPQDASFHLRGSLSDGRATATFSYGPPGMIPLVGDWAGRGSDSVGYYDPRDGSFHLREGLRSPTTYRAFTFGPPGMIPLAGDWNGDGPDGIGYYNRRDGWFRLRDSLSSGRARYAVRLSRGMIPVAGNFGGGRPDGVGYYNPRDGWFALRDSVRAATVSHAFRLGSGHMIPLAGD
jgi:surface antigen